MVNFEIREKKTKEAFASTIYLHSDSLLSLVKPEGFPSHCFFWEAQSISLLDNEINECPDLLQWHYLELPELHENKILQSKLPTPTPLGQPIDVKKENKRKQVEPNTNPLLNLSFLHQSTLQIPLKFAHDISNSTTNLMEILRIKIDEVKFLSPESIENTLHFLEELVSTPTVKEDKLQEFVSLRVIRHVLALFHLSEKDGIDYAELIKRYEGIQLWLTEASLRCDSLAREDLQNRCTQLGKVFYSAYNFLVIQRKYFYDGKLQSHPHFQDFIKEDDASVPTLCETGLEQFISGKEELKKMHYLLIYYMQYAESKGFRKGGDMVYAPRMLSNGQPTYEFVQYGDMDKFINSAINNSRTLSTVIWQWVYEGNNRKQLKDNLIFLENSKFPTLTKNRSLFAFEDGIYHTQLDRLFSWEEVNHLPFRENKVAVAKFHRDVYFRNEIYELILAKTGDWYSLPTPYLSKIWEAQGYSEEVKRFCCMCGGRMLQKLGTDNWQFMLWCIGTRGTGKTTFANLFSHIYSKEDVGTLSQIIEEKFGMQHFFDPTPKFVVVAPDLSKGLGLPLPIFLNWISAESACLPRKNKGAIERDLDIPFIAASNIMALQDIKDALARRCAFLKFSKTIRKSNTRLLDYIVKYELPIIIKKFTLAYWDYFQKYGHEDIWSWIPEYFQDTRAEMAAESNSIRFWLKRSGKIDVLHQDIRNLKSEHDHLMCTPLARLEDAYNEWKKTLGTKDRENALKWTYENYYPVFEDLKCQLFQYTGMWPPGSKMSQHKMENEILVKNVVIVEDAKKHFQAMENLRKKLVSPEESKSFQPQDEPISTNLKKRKVDSDQDGSSSQPTTKHSRRQPSLGPLYP